jgi:ribonuclease HII
MQIDQNYLKKYSCIIGADEVGRGPIAGAVNACAVAIEKTHFDIISYLAKRGVTDSKKLSSKKRLMILEELGIDITKLKLNQMTTIVINNCAIDFILGEKSPKEIDNMNILQASLSCMQKCSDSLVRTNAIVLVDGNKSFKTQAEDIVPIVKGDSKSVVIALASIIAKEYRDYQMQKWDKRYPGYDLAQNAGYPTTKHKEAIKKLGITPIHRKTFSGVKEYV